MTVLAEVAAFLPDGSVPVEELGPWLGPTPARVRVLRRFNGLGQAVAGLDDPPGAVEPVLSSDGRHFSHEDTAALAPAIEEVAVRAATEPDTAAVGGVPAEANP